jgi:hypothetical protein
VRIRLIKSFKTQSPQSRPPGSLQRRFAANQSRIFDGSSLRFPPHHRTERRCATLCVVPPQTPA